MSLTVDTRKEKTTDKTGLIFHIPRSLLDIKKSIAEKSIQDKAKIEQKGIIPFVQMKISNAAELYRITKSFINDIETGKKSFGVLPVGTNKNDHYMLALASGISYSRNNCPVLLVVDDLNSADWDKYRSQFTKGILGHADTYDWGPLCLLDHNELFRKINSHQIDLKLIYSEFDVVFWSMPENHQIPFLKENYLDILRSLDSVSLVVKPGQVNLKELKKIESHFGALGIPLKGILHEGGKK